jgi:hypothetical protein
MRSGEGEGTTTRRREMATIVHESGVWLPGCKKPGLGCANGAMDNRMA